MPPSSIGADRTDPPARYCQRALPGDLAGFCPCPPLRALSFSSVGQSARALDFAVSVVINSSREPAVIDLLGVSYAKPELSCRRNMSWLAEKQVFRCVMVELAVVCCDAVCIVVPQGRRASLTALRLNVLQFDRVHRNWVR